MTHSGRAERRIVHTSDLHLEVLNDRPCQSLRLLVDLAIQIEADLIVVAGDFFDSNRVKDDLVRFVVEQLQRLLPARVLIAPGNHDCLLPESVYNRVGLWEGATNVRIFKALQGETLVFPELGVSVWGKPIASYGGDERPLAGMPHLQRDGQWHIAVVHGYYAGPNARPWASFQIADEEVTASGQDYIALGDSHAFSCVHNGSVKAYYSGSPAYASETVAIVNLMEKTGVQVAGYSLKELSLKFMY